MQGEIWDRIELNNECPERRQKDIENRTIHEGAEHGANMARKFYVGT